MTQPMLMIECQGCGTVEWIGFLPDEWVRFVAPCQLGDGSEVGGQG